MSLLALWLYFWGVVATATLLSLSKTVIKITVLDASPLKLTFTSDYVKDKRKHWEWFFLFLVVSWPVYIPYRLITGYSNE
jgi:hypothetical protein